MPHRMHRTIVRLAKRVLSLDRHRFLAVDDKLVTAEQVDYIAALSSLHTLSLQAVGHIVELGVGRGRNSIIFGSLICHSSQEEFKRYIGFDTFDGYTLADIDSSPHLNPAEHRDTSVDFVIGQARVNGLDRICHFVEGDLVEELPRIIRRPEPGMKFSSGHLLISLLYIDCNSYRAAAAALELCQPHLAEGAVVAVDETVQGGETRALSEFAKRTGQQVQGGSFGSVVSAYLIWADPESRKPSV